MADSRYPDEWRGLAQKDWKRVDIGLSAGDAGLAGFLLQQSLEKYLKAYLLGDGWTLRRTHELDALLNEGAAFDASLTRFLDLCERVSGYYLAERYPIAGWTGLTLDDIKNDRSEAGELIQALFPGEL